ncbi:MAG: oligosaccharide flippase family protein, partial [Candidatus Krumholzibacteria bacterium]|nr:oligosaccharide flippase family protein [Candidatus Krumholzibacteria bacterium]
MERKGPVDLSTAKVISDTFFVSTSRIGVMLLKPIRGFVLGRLLGPSLYGLLNIPVPYVNIFNILSNIGFNTSVIRLIPGYRQKGRADLARMIYRSTALLTITLSVIWSILLLFCSRWIVGNLAHEPDAINPMRAYALIKPFLAMNAFYAAAFLAFQRGKLRAAITAAHGILNVLLPVLAILWKRNVTIVIGGFLTAEAIGTVLFAVFFHRKILSGLSRTVGPLLRGMNEVFRFGILFFFADLGWNMINSVDRLMVKYFLPVESYGFYSMASLVITALTVAASTAGVALVPSLTAAKESGDTRVFKKQIQNTARLGFIVLVPATAVIYVLTGDI